MKFKNFFTATKGQPFIFLNVWMLLSSLIIATVKPLMAQPDNPEWDLPGIEDTIDGKIEIKPDILLKIVEWPFEKDSNFYDVQKPASFPFGKMELTKFLLKNIKYPVYAIEHNIQGEVLLHFKVDQIGNINNVMIKKDIGGGCGKEVERVIKAMPDWSAGEANGYVVNSTIEIKFIFKLK